MVRFFAAIRERAAQRNLVIVRPDGRPLTMPVSGHETAPPEAVSAAAELLRSSEPRNVAAIADTSWTMRAQPGLADAERAIPFFALLLGLASIGHAVWVFDGTPLPVLAAGGRDADLAIVDGGSLPAGWRSLLTPVMRTPRILTYDRDTNQLRGN